MLGKGGKNQCSRNSLPRKKINSEFGGLLLPIEGLFCSGFERDLLTGSEGITDRNQQETGLLLQQEETDQGDPVVKGTIFFVLLCSEWHS